MPDTTVAQACDGAIATLDQFSALLSRVKASVKRVRKFPVPAEIRDGLVTAIVNFDRGLAVGGAFQNFAALEKVFASIEGTLTDLEKRYRH